MCCGDQLNSPMKADIKWHAGPVGSVENGVVVAQCAAVCFSSLEPTLHGSPALFLAADVVVLPLHTRH